MIDFLTLNKNLVETENIISSKYRFKFSNLDEPDISESDMTMNILQARVITEGMCRFIVLQEHLVKNEKSIRTATLKVYVDDLLRPNLIVPKSIVSNLSTIQGISNLAVHFQVDGNLNLKEAYICLESLESVMAWFVKTYSGTVSKTNKWKISTDMLNNSGAVPPKAEGCIISRNSEVGEIRNLILSRKTIILRGCTGVGKTELAKDYVKRYRKKYDGIYYAENVDEINDYLYNLPIGIIDEDKKTQEEIVEEKLEVIHSMDLTYLFIIDNYTGNPEELTPVFPNENDRYHLMIIVGEEYGNDSERYYDVNTFTPDESMQIFRYFCDLKYDDEEVMKLLSYLSYNPCAIKMSAVFLRDNDLYSPDGLIKVMKKNLSVQSIMQNLYIVLTEISILESDEEIRLVAECLSLIPYNGVSRERFMSLLYNNRKSCLDENRIDSVLEKLEDAGWMNIDNMGYISINPLLSDTIFEKTHPDMTSETIVNFVEPILKPTRQIRDLYLAQVIALEPFVEHLTKRAESCDACNLDILNDIREYYIAVYDVPNIELVTHLMEKEFARYELNMNVDLVENAIYRQGISRFNFEDFKGAHIHFSRSLEMLDNKMITIEKDIARICAYEGSSLAALGQAENAIKCAKRSIELREKLSELGDTKEEKALWISHYNYAKVLMGLKRFDDADKEISMAISIYEKHNPDDYKNWKSINVSSLFQLKGRIYAGLGQYDKAIKLLEDAKSIREKQKGETYFSTAQIYSYLMEVYGMSGDNKNALIYAKLYYEALLVQHKTEDIKTRIIYVESQIALYEENLQNV